MIQKLLVCSTIAALAATPAIAQQAPPPGVAQGTTAAPPAMTPHSPPVIRTQRVEIHEMGDRVMTRDDVVKHVREMFERLDTNHDGFITKDEVEAFHRKIASAQDKGTEMRKHLSEHHMPMRDRGAMFDRLDTNHDGVISREEFMAGQPSAREERVIFMMRDAHAKNGTGQPEPHELPMHGAAMGMGFAGRLFEIADANHDGRVSLKEAEDAALARFDRMDLNHDGKVTPEERQQARALMKEHKAN